MDLQLSDFISAGFFITREVDRPDYLSTDLLPDRLVSASGCICSCMPDTWCIEWTQDSQEARLEDAAAFGLASEELSVIIDWVTPRFGESIRWPNIISELATAQELFQRFLDKVLGVRILELCLHQSMVQEFCTLAEPPPPEPGFAPVGRLGVHEILLEKRPPASGGMVLGFEPLVFDYMLSCSWLCNSLEKELAKALGIKPNQHGLLNSLSEATKGVDHISRDDVGAEPGLWLPWLLIDHTTSCKQGVSSSHLLTSPKK